MDPRAWTRTARATWTFMALCAAGAAASLVALSPADAVAPAPILPGPRVAALPPASPPRPEASPPVAPGPIVLASDPAGADVLSNGVVLGRTPLTLPRPEAGARVALTVRRRGRHERRVILGASSAERVHVELTPRRARPRRAPAAPLPEPPAEPELEPEPPAPPVHTRFLDPWAARPAVVDPPSAAP